jgi:hypothetical protein
VRRPPPPRYTFRLPWALDTLLAARVGPGETVSDVVRRALEAYLGVCPTREAPVSDTGRVASDTSADLSDVYTRLAALERDAPAVDDMLVALEARLAEVEQALAAVAPPATENGAATLAATLAALTARLAQVEHDVQALAWGFAPSDAAGPTLPAPTPPAFDPAKYRLGRLCDQGHDYQDTGQTLRRVPSGVCPQCDTAAQRTRRAARRNGPALEPHPGARAPQGRGNGA